MRYYILSGVLLTLILGFGVHDTYASWDLESLQKEVDDKAIRILTESRELDCFSKILNLFDLAQPPQGNVNKDILSRSHRIFSEEHFDDGFFINAKEDVEKKEKLLFQLIHDNKKVFIKDSFAGLVKNCQVSGCADLYSALNVAFSYWKEVKFRHTVNARNIALRYEEWTQERKGRGAWFLYFYEAQGDKAKRNELLTWVKQDRALEEELARAEKAVLSEVQRIFKVSKDVGIGWYERPKASEGLVKTWAHRIEKNQLEILNLFYQKTSSQVQTQTTFRDLLLDQQSVLTQEEKEKLQKDYLAVDEFYSRLYGVYVTQGQDAHAGSALLKENLPKFLKTQEEWFPLFSDSLSYATVHSNLYNTQSNLANLNLENIRKALTTIQSAPQGIDPESGAPVQELLRRLYFFKEHFPVKGDQPMISPDQYGERHLLDALDNQEGTCLAGAGNRLGALYIRQLWALLNFRYHYLSSSFA